MGILFSFENFTYNLFHYIGELGAHVNVVRNDAISVNEILKMPDLQGVSA
jgi:anthranilate synthase component 2